MERQQHYTSPRTLARRLAQQKPRKAMRDLRCRRKLQTRVERGSMLSTPSNWLERRKCKAQKMNDFDDLDDECGRWN